MREYEQGGFPIMGIRQVDLLRRTNVLLLTLTSTTSIKFLIILRSAAYLSKCHLPSILDSITTIVKLLAPTVTLNPA
jgi:hypothetical protein